MFQAGFCRVWHWLTITPATRLFSLNRFLPPRPRVPLHRYLKFLREGKLDDQKVDIHVPVAQNKGANAGGSAIAIDPSALQGASLDQIFGRFAKAMSGGPRTVKRNLKVRSKHVWFEGVVRWACA